MQFDDILRKLGEFGTYQKRLYFLLCITSTVVAFHATISVFLLGTPEHRCAIPGYPNDTYEIQSDYHRQLINLTIPPSSDEDKEYNQCEIYDRQEGKSGNNATTASCSSWVYATDVFESTFTKEQNMVCDERLKTSHAQMIYFAGKLVGSLGLGAISDAIGRKKALYIAILTLLGSTLGVAFAPNFYVFCALRFLVGLSGTGIFVTSFVIGMELVGPSKRLWTGMVIEFFFAFGLLILSGVAYWLRHWMYIEIVCAVPAVFFLSYWWLIPESPRWLVSKGRFEEANEIFQKAAKVNKVSLPEKVLDKNSIEEVKTGRIWEIFTSRILLVRSLIIFFNWMVVSMVYYGLTVNSGNLGGDLYLNFLLSGVVEFPAYALCLFLLDRTGRRILHATCMVFGGVACISTIFTILYADESLQPVTVTLAMLGKLGISAGFAVIYVWAAEIFPTVIRNSGMGASSCCARVGSMAAPYIVDLTKIISGDMGRALPFAIFGTLSILAGICSIYLPETLNQSLPETIEDGEKFKGQRLFKKKQKYNFTEAYNNKAFENGVEKTDTKNVLCGLNMDTVK